MWGSGSLATLPRRVPRGESSCSGVSRSMMAGGEADVLMLQDQARRLPRCPQVTPCSWAQVNHPGEEDPGGPASFLPCMLYIFSGLLCWRWARGPSLFHFACMLPIRAGPAPGCVPALLLVVGVLVRGRGWGLVTAGCCSVRLGLNPGAVCLP